MSTGKIIDEFQWNDCPLFEYSALPHRKKWKWHNKYNIAFYIAINLEYFSWGSGLGATIGKPSCDNLSIKTPDVLNWSWREYGNRCGIWRMIDMLNDLDLPCSILANSSIHKNCPEIIDAFIKRGDEIIAHGETNSVKQSDMNYQQEKLMIYNTTNVLTKYNQNKNYYKYSVNGWLAPWISTTNKTLDILYENKYKYTLDYCMDDQPVWLKVDPTGNKKILSIPYPQEMNDIPYFLSNKYHITQFVDDIKDNFDELYEESVRNDTAYVCGLSLHPYIVGQPNRLRLLRNVLKYIKSVQETNSNVWITRPADLAKYIYNNPDLICNKRTIVQQSKL
eukprot:316725_1